MRPISSPYLGDALKVQYVRISVLKDFDVMLSYSGDILFFFQVWKIGQLRRFAPLSQYPTPPSTTKQSIHFSFN